MKHYSIIVIGAGAGGLVVAIGSAKAGKKVLLIEKGHYGGDCTNFGCIPSKSLIASAEVSHALAEGNEFGIDFECKGFNATKSLERVRGIISEVRSHEDPEALGKLGVETLTGFASFENSRELNVKMANGEQTRVSADKIVIASGSHPFIPPIEGLKDAPFLTNETIFDLKEIPKDLAILGAGPIGCELAQAFNRLGSNVTMIASKRGIMPNDDPEVGKLMAEVFKKEGITVHIKCETNMITYKENKFFICISVGESKEDFEADGLLVSTGRKANIEGMELDKAGIKYSEKGIPVDIFGRTNQKHIFAIGDVVGGPLFTHLAENHGRSVLTTLILPKLWKKKLDRAQEVPHCTFTSPEVASVGLTEKQALEKYGEKSIATYKVPLSEVDRAITANKTEGFVKVVTKKWSSQILGATIVAPRAGEMLPEISLAMLHKIPLRKLTRLIHPYPTYNAGIRKAADQWLIQTILPLLKGKK